MSDFVFDAPRLERIGLPEAIFCPGKTPEQIAAISAKALETLPAVLLTRLSEEAWKALVGHVGPVADRDALARTAILGRWSEPEGEPRVALVSAGTSDIPVLREAERTLAYSGVKAAVFPDIGVAGLWRLTARIEEIRRFPVILAFAGMEGALFSVLGGLVAGALVAVPTSNGYGVGAGGHVALNTALASCAPGITVTNIDNGYGAACAALRMLRLQG